MKIKSCEICKNNFMYTDDGECLFPQELEDFLYEDFGDWGASMQDAIMKAVAENCKNKNDGNLFYEEL